MPSDLCERRAIHVGESPAIGFEPVGEVMPVDRRRVCIPAVEDVLDGSETASIDIGCSSDRRRDAVEPSQCSGDLALDLLALGWRDV